MIAFEVSLNGKRACTAGVESGNGVLHTTVTWVRRKAPRRKVGLDEELRLDVGGLDSTARIDGEFLDWIEQPLRTGDRIQIRVLDTDHVEAPARRRPTFTTGEIEGQRARSYKSALAEARAQRRGLDRRIARLEREAKALKKSKKGKPTAIRRDR